MKPYKIHNTWVDLDSVMAVDDQPFCVHRLLTNISDVQGAVTLVFRDKPLLVCLDELLEDRDPYWPKKPTTKAIQTWDAFKIAWMNKDKQSP